MYWLKSVRLRTLQLMVKWDIHAGTFIVCYLLNEPSSLCSISPHNMYSVGTDIYTLLPFNINREQHARPQVLLNVVSTVKLTIRIQNTAL